MFLTVRQTALQFIDDSRSKMAGGAGRDGMDSRRFARDEGPDDRGCGEASTSRFRRTIADLEKSWAVETSRAPFYPFATWTTEGPRLGAATLLKRNGRGEDDCLLTEAL